MLLPSAFVAVVDVAGLELVFIICVVSRLLQAGLLGTHMSHYYMESRRASAALLELLHLSR